MDSPLILLVFWFVINLIIKSSKDKKKIEEARRKKSQQINNKPMQNNSTLSTNRDTVINRKKRNRSIIDVLKEEIDREVQKEKQVQRERQTKPIKSQNERYITNLTKEAPEDRKIKERRLVEEIKPEQVLNPIVANKERLDTTTFDIKKDILKGIVYKEILSEPKSLRNTRRSM